MRTFNRCLIILVILMLLFNLVLLYLKLKGR